jgi:hypothetical protein
VLVICARTARTEEYSISPITRKTLRERKKIPSSDHKTVYTARTEDCVLRSHERQTDSSNR